MSFRVKIISPLHAADADLARRQQRYEEATQTQTELVVENLANGPVALNTAGDVLISAAAIFEQCRKTKLEDFHTILVDCVFDPAVKELQEATGLPTFGPTEVTLPLISLVSDNFSIIARTDRQCELLAETVSRYGFGEKIRSLRALGISYEEAKQKSTFNQVMSARLEEAVSEDSAGAIMFGSTTMAISDEMIARSQGVPLFMPGMVAIQVMEQLWYSDLWPG